MAEIRSGVPWDDGPADLGTPPEVAYGGAVSTELLTGRERISLVIPLYNSADFIDAALGSVAGQTRLPDEVVVVDDGSTDAGAVRAGRWATLLPLRVLSLVENRGLGYARRAGIEATTGELIALLDADDVWLPDHLETLLAAYRRHGGLITADTLWWAPGRQLSAVSGHRRKRVPPPERQRLGILDHNFVHPMSLFARADYDRAGGFADLRKMEDWDLWIRMIQSGVTVTMAPMPTGLYRIHGGSLSAGRGNLATNLHVLPSILPRLARDERRVLRRTIRRRRARVHLLAGERQAADGRLGGAVREWMKAAVIDRRLGGGLTGGRSSVTLQALGNLITGGRVGSVRRGRANAAGTGLRGR